MTQLVWPNGTIEEPTCTDVYGPRGWSAPGVRAFHTGDDSVGYSQVCSIGAGTVIETSRISWAGNQVLVYLGEIDGIRVWVRTCHLASPSHLSRGDQVELGGLIGVMGMTGVAFGVHNHMEIYLGRVDRGGGTGPHDVGTTVDPREFIRAHLSSQNQPDGQEEDEDMKPICIAQDLTGDIEVTIFNFDTGEEHTFTSLRNAVGHAYNTNVALTYGCAPAVPISYVSVSHYTKIKSENKATRARLAKSKA